MFPPSNAILEPQVRELERQLRFKANQWFSNRGIEIIESNGYYFLKKNGDANHWNMICNGTVFNSDGHLVSMPPTKLYKSTETILTHSRCDIIEKIPGDMICACWTYGIYPYYHTDSSFCSKEIFDKVNFSNFKYEKEYTLTFQLHEKKLYLVAVRLLRDLSEYSEDELETLAASMGVFRPKRYYGSVSDVIAENKKEFILRDKNTGERVKLWINIKPHMLENMRRLITYWLSGEDYQVSLQHPETKRSFVRIEEAAKGRVNYLKDSAKKWKACYLSRQGLATSLEESNEPTWARKIIINMQELHESTWDNVAMSSLKKITSKTLMNILGLEG